MDAPADYSAAVRALTRNLPAYISYTIHSFVHVGVDHEQTDQVVVRTSDGKIVKGKRPAINVGTGDRAKSGSVHDVPFDPKCYTATGAHTVQFEGRTAEQIDLRPTCHDRGDNEADAKTSGDFTKLYVDPVSYSPLAAIGEGTDKTVAVHLEQRFTNASGHVVPASFRVEIKGSGFMFWLNILVREEFSRFGFSNSPP